MKSALTFDAARRFATGKTVCFEAAINEAPMPLFFIEFSDGDAITDPSGRRFATEDDAIEHAVRALQHVILNGAKLDEIHTYYMTIRDSVGTPIFETRIKTKGVQAH